MSPDLKGAKAIADVLQQVWGLPVSAEDVYRYLGRIKEPLPCIRHRLRGARSGKLYAHSESVREWAKSIKTELDEF